MPYKSVFDYIPKCIQLRLPLGSGIGIPTDRDQQSWVFRNDPKNTLPLTGNSEKYFLKSETLKNTLPRHDSFEKS